jgi:hypothetical protein
MNSRFLRVVRFTAVTASLVLVGCSDQGSNPSVAPDPVNPHQAEVEAHTAICEGILQRVERDAISIVSLGDLECAISSGFSDACMENGLQADFTTAVAGGANVMEWYMRTENSGGAMAKTEGISEWLEDKLRASYAEEEVEIFLQLRKKMFKRLTPEQYSQEVARAERYLLQHPTASSDAMMRTLALARTSYRFWSEKGGEHVRRLRSAFQPQFSVAKVDTGGEITTGSAAVVDMETMVVCGIGGLTAVVALEASGAASAVQFIYDNRNLLWDVFTSEIAWQLWLSGYLY